MQFPKVSGTDLKRRKRTFPADFAGDLNLVFIPFQQWHQAHVDTWVPTMLKLEEDFPGFRFYEFPTIQRMNVISRTFINEGMRAGIRDEETRGRTVTLYIDKEPFKAALDIPNEENIWLFLCAGDGQIFWRSTGPFDLKLGASLREIVEEKNLTTA